TTSEGRFPLTELDQVALFRPLTNTQGVIQAAGRLPRMVRRAIREITTGRPGSAHLGLPFDVQKAPVPEKEIWADPAFGHFPALPAGPDGKVIDQLLQALLSASRPIVICGGGVVLADGMDALSRFATTLDLPVATTVSGQGALAETDPACLGVVGSNGGQPAMRDVVDAADLVLFIGCRAGSVTTERWRSPPPGVRILHIDSDPHVIGACYDTEVALVSDARLALEALVAALGDENGHPTFGGAAITAKAKAAKWAAFSPLAVSEATPIRPERVIAALAEALPDDAIVCADPGTPCPYFSAWYAWPRAGRHFITNRAHGALGYAIGASVGAQIGRPQAKVVCATGDGSFGMSVGELETIVRLGLPITIIVFSNSVFGWIKAGQKSGFGERYFSVDFSRTDHAAVASAYGLKTWTVEDPRDLDPALAAAIRFDGPTLIDVIAQPLQEAAAPVSEWVA
ncbi:MAG: thiamine pyrophosphate-binding protein, partial [Pseudomonadota bacterium]